VRSRDRRIGGDSVSWRMHRVFGSRVTRPEKSARAGNARVSLPLAAFARRKNPQNRSRDRRSGRPDSAPRSGCFLVPADFLTGSPTDSAVRSARFVSRLTNGGKSLARARRHGLPVCLSTTVEFFPAIARGRVRRRNQPRNWRYGLVASRIQKRENSRRNKTDAAFTSAPVPLASFSGTPR